MAHNKITELEQWAIKCYGTNDRRCSKKGPRSNSPLRELSGIYNQGGYELVATHYYKRETCERLQKPVYIVGIVLRSVFSLI